MMALSLILVSKSSGKTQKTVQYQSEVKTIKMSRTGNKTRYLILFNNKAAYYHVHLNSQHLKCLRKSITEKRPILFRADPKSLEIKDCQTLRFTRLQM